MTKITGFSVMTTGEGKRVTVNYSVLDDAGNIRDTNLRANYVALDDTVLAAIAAIEQDAAAHLEYHWPPGGCAGSVATSGLPRRRLQTSGAQVPGFPAGKTASKRTKPPGKRSAFREVSCLWVVMGCSARESGGHIHAPVITCRGS